MNPSWTLLCCAAFAASLIACKGSAPGPTEGDPETDSEAAAAADESTKPDTTPAEMPDIPAPPDVAAVPKDAEKSESGLASRVLQKGTGTEHPTATSTVRLNFTGWTTDGKMFVSTREQLVPADLVVNQLMPGWTEGLQLMVVGETRRLWIPENLAFAGQTGAPRGMLVYDILLAGFKD